MTGTSSHAAIYCMPSRSHIYNGLVYGHTLKKSQQGLRPWTKGFGKQASSPSSLPASVSHFRHPFPVSCSDPSLNCEKWGTVSFTQRLQNASRYPRLSLKGFSGREHQLSPVPGGATLCRRGTGTEFHGVQRGHPYERHYPWAVASALRWSTSTESRPRPR